MLSCSLFKSGENLDLSTFNSQENFVFELNIMLILNGSHYAFMYDGNNSYVNSSDNKGS